jgi:hypothetical protein
MDIVWILLPSPFVGYVIADSVRKIFSEDDRLLRRLLAEQPVTGLAALTAIGSVVVWVVSEAVLRFVR